MECLQMALMSQQEKENFKQELLEVVEQDSDCFEQAKTLLLYAKAFKNIKKEDKYLSDLEINYIFL